MITREVEYEADDRRLVGRIAVPDGPGPFPGVLIAHEGGGLDDLQRQRADRFAELGYVGFALDYHGDAAPFADAAAMVARRQELISPPDRIRALGHAGLDQLQREPSVDPSRVAAVGYCLGGTLALELGRSDADLKAIVGFHPGLVSTSPDDSRNIRGRVLVCVGSDDPIVPREHRIAFEEEMDAAGVDWQMHVYGGVPHSFTHPDADRGGWPGIAYNKVADRRSWHAMLRLLAEVF